MTIKIKTVEQYFHVVLFVVVSFSTCGSKGLQDALFEPLFVFLSFKARGRPGLASRSPASLQH